MAELTSAPVPSPCTQVCRIAPDSGLCVGCWRTLDEIAAWSAMGDADKHRVWQALDGRRTQATPLPTPTNPDKP